MDSKIRSRNRGLVIILIIFTITYSLSIPYSVLVQIGVQSPIPYRELVSLPWFILINTIGVFSSLAALYRRKWGVYGLVIVWLFTSIQDFVLHTSHTLSAPVYHFTFWLILAFFLSLLPAWRNYK